MSVLPQDETGKPERGYDYDFEMEKVAIYVDDGAGGVQLWDGTADFGGDVEIDTDALEQIVTDSLEHYKFYAWEVDTSVYYIGYQTKAGAWYSKKIDPSAGTCLYAAGASSPPTAANLSAQSYAAFEATF